MAKQKTELTFQIFFYTYAKINNWDVPAFHWDIVAFLDSYDDWSNATAVLQVFRGAGKSTIVAAFIVYMLVKDPTLRFLLMGANFNVSAKIVRDCQRIIHIHPLAKKLKGREQSWRADQFFVRGSTDARNASVSCFGVTSNITSARADFVIFDDVEVYRTSSTEMLRANLRSRIEETQHLLIPQTGRKLFIGTPHAYESIYPEWIERGATSLKLPLIINPEGEFPYITGESRWPERFDQSTISERQLNAESKNNFLSQYQLIPCSIEDTYFDASKLKIYRDEIEFKSANGERYASLCNETIRSVAAFWDVATDRPGGDDSVLAIVFFSDDRKVFVHRTEKLTGDIDTQCLQVKRLIREFNLPMVCVETNGVGAMVPAILITYTRGMNCGIDGVHSNSNKAQKIIDAIDVRLASGDIYISQEVANGKLIDQVRDFVPKKIGHDHDDYIDSVASALISQPIFLKRGGNNDAIDSWGNNANGSVEAEVDYVTLSA